MMKDNISLLDVSKKTGVSVDKLRRLRKEGRIPQGWQAHAHAPIIFSLKEFKLIEASL
jgi:hypothetical protein